MTRIMIIRHAEKPDGKGPVHGVSVSGVHDRHELTVRGWQRAGALVRYFAPHDGVFHTPLLSQPRAIFTSAATADSPSFRSQNTVAPLAAMLGMRIDIGHPEGDEDGLAATVLANEGPALISWHHKRIPALIDAITGFAVARPGHWPDRRFDIVWVLDRDHPGAPWLFAQTPQRLLPSDSVTLIG